MVVLRREITGGVPTEERGYYLSSLDADEKNIGKAIRTRWGIENGLHLDAGRKQSCKKRALFKDKL